MSREEIYEKLTVVFRDVFDDGEIEICDETTAKDIEDWDSLEQINLVVAIEKKFDFRFHMDEVTNFKNVGEMVDIIQKRTGHESF